MHDASMQRKPQVTVRLEPKDLTVIKKAAKIERRSINQFVLLAALTAAQTRIAVEKVRPSSGFSEEASA